MSSEPTLPGPVCPFWPVPVTIGAEVLGVLAMELLEREPFLRTLGEYAGEARQGEGRLVLVSGESGMGKTALLEAFQHRTKGTRWLWGACDGLLTPGRSARCSTSPRRPAGN